MGNLPVQFRGTLVDGMNLPGNVIGYLSLPDTATLAQLQSAAGVWAAAMDAAMDVAFTGLSAAIVPVLPGGLKAATGTTWTLSRMAQTGTISFSVTGTSRHYGQAIPGLSSACISNDKVDLTNAAIAALTALLLTPGDFFTNPNSQGLVAVLDALLSFRQYANLGLRSERV